MHVILYGTIPCNLGASAKDASENRGVAGSIPALAICDTARLLPQIGVFLAKLHDGTPGVRDAGSALGVQFGVQNPLAGR